MKKFVLFLITISMLILVGCNSSGSVDDNRLNYKDFKGFDMPADQVNLKVDGKDLTLTMPIYLEKNRYYLSLNEILDQLNGSLNKEDDILKVNINDINITIDLSNNLVKTSSKEFSLKSPLKTSDGFYYIGFSDLSNMLELYTRWDVGNKLINCKINGSNLENITPYNAKIEQVGYLRLEDIDLTTQSYDGEFLEKVRIIGNYLSKKDVPYHIAWIPRYMSPTQNIDVDPMAINDFANAEMVYTLDYFTQNSGLIGLHGYTHQSNNEESAVGTEFGYGQPSTDRFRERIEKAIETAKYLDIPITFFETPHYEITAEQNKIAEEYFKILYHPFKDNGQGAIDLTKPQLSPYNKKSYYISTALDYIPLDKKDTALTRIKNADIKNMGSLFYHPRLDFDFISLSEEEGMPTFNYKDDALLKQVINALEVKGFKMSKVSDI